MLKYDNKIFLRVLKEYCIVLNLQPLIVNTASLAVAENMADLIDGFCRFMNGQDSSVMARPKKGGFFLCLQRYVEKGIPETCLFKNIYIIST